MSTYILQQLRSLIRCLLLEDEDLIPVFFMLITVQPFFFASSLSARHRNQQQHKQCKDAKLNDCSTDKLSVLGRLLLLFELLQLLLQDLLLLRFR